MADILIIRHAQSYANVGDRTAYGNEKAPLTEKGIAQSIALGELLVAEFGIDPRTYDKPVAASEFLRTQQTAEYAGFKNIHVLPLINESDVARDILSGRDVIKKHMRERWVPTETAERVNELHDGLSEGRYNDYEIFFGHGMFWSGFLLECDVRHIETTATFTDRRGYVPLQTGIAIVRNARQ